jgi:hypothetical protein
MSQRKTAYFSIVNYFHVFQIKFIIINYKIFYFQTILWKQYKTATGVNKLWYKHSGSCRAQEKSEKHSAIYVTCFS